MLTVAVFMNVNCRLVQWNVHEPSPGLYDFEGQHDLVNFIQTAQKVGLLVILRLGPYTCAEWDFVSCFLLKITRIAPHYCVSDFHLLENS